RSGGEEGLAVVLPLLADLEPDSPWRREAAVASALRALVEARVGKPLYADVLQAAASYPELMKDGLVQQRVVDSLQDRSLEARRAALSIVLYRLLEGPALAPVAQKSIAGFDGGFRGMLRPQPSAPTKATYQARA